MWHFCPKFSGKSKFSSSKSKKNEKNNCSKVFFLTISLCTFRLMFRHTDYFFCRTEQKTHPKSQKSRLSYNLLSSFFPQSVALDTWNAILATLFWVFCQKLDISSQTPDTLKQLHKLTKKILQTFFWRSRLQIWQTWQKFYAESPIYFAKRPKSLSKCSSFHKLSKNCSSGDV